MAVCLMLLVVVAQAGPGAGALSERSVVGAHRPWRASEALGLSWLRLGFEQRTRFEHLQDDFRTVSTGRATGLFLRTLVSVELRVRPFIIVAELQDSRGWVNDTAPVNTGLINPFELAQGYVGLRAENVFSQGDSASLSLGRMTIDLGSRRLLARNDFRNTINSFTGLDLQWVSAARDGVRVFAVMPVMRLPFDGEGLRQNRVEFDLENTSALVWAAAFQSRPLVGGLALEMYVVGLHERDSRWGPTLNRQLATPALRVFRPPGSGRFDFQFEVMGQFGRSRLNLGAADMNHRAVSLHASTGYRFDTWWAPRVVLQYDYASGDASASDNTNNRFDSLFGARRFEFGPTGLYGALARSNLSSPGLRFEAEPHRSLEVMAAYRLVWLASAGDGWSTTGLRDPTGESGAFVGQQGELRLRWHVARKNFSIEAGGSVLLRGSFALRAPQARATTPVYFYTQLTVSL